MNKQIEDFLGLSQQEIKARKSLIIMSLPTTPGIAYLEQRLKEFESQPWPFIIYLAHYNQSALQENLVSYTSYSGSEGVGVIKEKLKENYILGLLLYEGIMALKNRSQSTPS